MDQQIWIVGFRDMDGTKPWEFVGAYDSKEKAFAVCKDCRFFAARVGLNDTAPEEESPWPEHHQPSHEWPAHWTDETIADWERRNPE